VSTSSLAATKGLAMEPTELEFTSVGEKSYTVRFTSKLHPSGTTGFGRFLLSDRKHRSTAWPARSIAFRWT
jgi:hypothetical protein